MYKYIMLISLFFVFTTCKNTVMLSNSDIEDCLYTETSFLYNDSLNICEQGLRLGQESMFLLFENTIFEKKTNLFSSRIKIIDLAVKENIPYVSLRKGYFNGKIIYDMGIVASSNTEGEMEASFVVNDSCNVVFFTHPAYVMQVYKVNNKTFCRRKNLPDGARMK